MNEISVYNIIHMENKSSTYDGFTGTNQVVSGGGGRVRVLVFTI
jgi:hypothetical protein